MKNTIYILILGIITSCNQKQNDLNLTTNDQIKEHKFENPSDKSNISNQTEPNKKELREIQPDYFESS